MPTGGPPNWRAIITASTAKTYTNSIGMVFEPVPEGSFVMGRFEPTCPAEHPAQPAPLGPPTYWTRADYARCEVLAKKAYRPGFVVDIRKPFLMGKHEVTQAQFEQVMGRNPDRRTC